MSPWKRCCGADDVPRRVRACWTMVDSGQWSVGVHAVQPAPRDTLGFVSSRVETTSSSNCKRESMSPRASVALLFCLSDQLMATPPGGQMSRTTVRLSLSSRQLISALAASIHRCSRPNIPFLFLSPRESSYGRCSVSFPVRRGVTDTAPSKKHLPATRLRLFTDSDFPIVVNLVISLSYVIVIVTANGLSA